MANHIKSVEYIEITLTGTTAVSADLTLGQAIADCVPRIAGVSLTSGATSQVGARYCEVYFTAGTPNKVTAIRGDNSGTAVVGIFITEYDTTVVTVQQGTFSSTGAQDTEVIDAVVLAKAYIIHNYQITGAGGDQAWNSGAVKVIFGSTTGLTFDRHGTVGTMQGRWYVVSHGASVFTVDHQQLTLSTTAELIEGAISATVLVDTMLISSYSTEFATDNVASGSVVTDLKDTTTPRSRRAFNDFGDDTADAAAANICTIEIQIIECQANEWAVQRFECNWGTSLTKTVAITSTDLARSVVVPGGYQGGMSSAEESSGEGSGNSAILDFTGDEEVTGTRAHDTDPDGTTMLEVVQFELVAVASAVIRRRRADAGVWL